MRRCAGGGHHNGIGFTLKNQKASAIFVYFLQDGLGFKRLLSPQ